MTDIVISGYYGFRNNGDDALLMSIINDLKSKNNDLNIVVLSKNPRETERIYGVRAVDRHNILSVLKAIKNTKMLISGGGTLIQDATSTKSLIYYLAIIKMALLFKKKVMLYANGIGPLNLRKNRRLTKRILNKVDLITLRDEISYDLLKEIGVTKPKIEVTADPAFGIGVSGREEDMLAINNIPTDEPLMMVSVRPYKNAVADFSSIVSNGLDYAYTKYGVRAVFLPMQTKTDEEISEEIREKMKEESYIIKADYDIPRLLSIMSKMKICIGMRLHTLIYSAVSMVPLVGLVYDPKINGFLDYIGIDNYLSVENLNIEDFKKAIDKSFENFDTQKEKLEEKRNELMEKAKRNSFLATELLLG